MNLQHISAIYVTTLNICLSIVPYLLPPLLMIVPVTEFPRRRSPPKKKTVKPVYRQQGKQTPLIMSITSQFPLSLAYACLGDHRDTFFRIVEPILMHDLSF